MVDPAVLENVGYDSERYTGFAFGMGSGMIAAIAHKMFFEQVAPYVTFSIVMAIGLCL